MCLLKGQKKNYKKSRSKEGNKQTHKRTQTQNTKQVNLCHLDNNKNVLNMISPTILQSEKRYKY